MFLKLAQFLRGLELCLAFESEGAQVLLTWEYVNFLLLDPLADTRFAPSEPQAGYHQPDVWIPLIKDKWEISTTHLYL